MSASPDLSEFAALSRPKKPPCQVGVARAALRLDSERAQLDAACAEHRNVITAGAIAAWLDLRGQQVNASAVTAHRKNTCTCAA